MQETIKRRVIKYNALRCKKQVKLYNALQKYGPDNFLIEIIDHAPDQMHLDDLEDIYIDKFDSIQNGYNIARGSRRAPMTEEIKRKISLANMGEKHHFYGKTHNDESRKMISESLKKTWAERGGGPNKGRKFSDEVRLKMSASHKGRIFSEETKLKLSLAAKQRWAK